MPKPHPPDPRTPPRLASPAHVEASPSVPAKLSTKLMDRAPPLPPRITFMVRPRPVLTAPTTRPVLQHQN